MTGGYLRGCPWWVWGILCIINDTFCQRTAWAPTAKNVNHPPHFNSLILFLCSFLFSVFKSFLNSQIDRLVQMDHSAISPSLMVLFYSQSITHYLTIMDVGCLPMGGHSHQKEFFRWHSYMFWSLANNHDVKDGLKGVTTVTPTIIITITSIKLAPHPPSQHYCH